MKIDLRPYAQRPLNQIKHRIYTKNGEVRDGYFYAFIPANDNDPEEDAVMFFPTKEAKSGWGFFEHEIERIEPLE